ncbi:MAG: DUF86 domain-containing protein [archaeon]|nr:DUF86 domain-containing protein [archaeon]
MRMKSVDKDLVEAKFDIIERNLKFLKEFENMDESSFMRNFRDIQASKYSLLEITEACIDIANHIIASEGYRRAETYSDMFDILLEERVINKKPADRLTEMAGFRNLLVHRYGEIDDKHVLEIIQKDMKDVKMFMKGVSKFLEDE